MASFVNIHRGLSRTRAIVGSLNFIAVSGYRALCCLISRPFPCLKLTYHAATPPASACICCQDRCSRFTVGWCWCQAAIIILLPLPKLRCGHLWFLSCLRDVPGFDVFPQNPCLYIFFPTLVPDPNPLSLLPPHCADKQPGAMAAEEVTCGIFSWFLIAMAAVSLSEADGVLSVVSLSALIICAVIE